MNGFFWTAGHFGWGVFALVVFSALWFLLSDLVWRLSNVKIGRLVMALAIGWIIIASQIVLGFHIGSG